MKLFKHLTRQSRFLIFGFIIVALIPAAIFIAKNPGLVKADSLISFDEGGGTTTKDNQNNASGTITNAVWKSEEFCISGKCLFFDGTGDYVSFGDEADFDFAAATNWTVSLWFRHAPKTSGTEVLVAKTNASAGYKILMESDGDITFAVDDDTTWTPDDSVTSTAATYDDNRWHHISAVKTGTTKIELFIDGQLIGSDASIAATGTLVNSTNFYVGIDGDGSSNAYTGFIDQLNVYTTTARTAGQVKSDAIRGAGKQGASAVFGQSDPLSNGLVGYWKMDEASDATRVDSSGNGNNLTESASDTVVQSTGKYGSAGDFERGDTEYLEVADNSSLDLGTTFTLSAWMNVESTTGAYESAIIKGTTNGTWSYSLGTVNNNIVGVMIDSDGWVGGGVEIVTAADFITPGEWTHITITYDGSYVRIFKNGAEQVSNNFPYATTITPFNSSGALRLGYWESQSAYFDGILDEVRIYNRAISPAEVAKLYSWAPGPVGYWKMDENTGTAVNDGSGNGNTGTLNSGSWSTGKYGQSVSTSPDGSYINVDSVTNDSVAPEYTINFWFNLASDFDSSKTVSQYLFSYADQNSTNDLSIFLDEIDGTLTLKHNFGANEATLYNTSYNTWTAGTWYHVTAYFSTQNGVKLYVNGVVIDSEAQYIRNSVNSTIARIGSSWQGGTSALARIDDFRFYNYPRTPGQIVEDMNGGHPTPGSPVGSALGYWDYDEGFGNTLHNSGNTGSTLDGPITNANWTNDGKFNKGLAFNGTDALVDFGIGTIANRLNGASGLTLSTWMKADAYPGGSSRARMISLHVGDGSSGALLSVYGSGQVEAAGRSGTGDSLQTATYTLPDSTSWHHVIGIFDYPNDQIRIHVDGKLVTTQSVTFGNSVFTIGTLTTAHDSFGAFKTTSEGDYFDGTLDMTKIYNFALTNEQIMTEYNQGKSAVMGSSGTNSSGVADNSAARTYCPPGNTEGRCGSGDPSPIAHWDLNENTGSVVYDKTGNGNTSSAFTGNVSWITGKLSGGLKFNGNNDVVRIPETASTTDLGNADSYTVSAWVKTTDATAGTDDIVAKHGSNTGAAPLRIYLTSTARVPGFVIRDASTGRDVTGTAGVNDGRWHHIVGVRDVANDAVYLYVDGLLVDSDSDNTTGSLANDHDISFGNGRNGYGADPYNGDIDAVSIYNYVRTPAQVAWDYNQGAPIAHWEMNETSWNTTANEVKDSSGNALHGTAVADATTAVGKFNNGGTFDGTDDRITIEDNSILNLTTQFSVTAWIKRDVTGTDTIYQSGTQSSYWAVDIRNDKLNFFEVFSADYMSTRTITDTNWHHVAVVKDGDGASNLKLYIDGQLDSTHSSGTVTTPSGQKKIGRADWQAGTAIDGMLDDVRIYNYPLNPTQIQTIMNLNSAVKF